MTVGVYEREEDMRADVADINGPHRHAARSDETGLVWLFLVEGLDAQPLAPLSKYNFEVQ